MSMEAVVLVRVPMAALKEALGEAEAPAGHANETHATAWLAGPRGAMAARALDEGVILHTGMAVTDVEPAELGMVVGALLGPAASLHDDERGVLVCPARAVPGDATSYDAVVAEAADLGDWVTPAAPPTDMAAMMGQMMGGLGGGDMQGLFQQAQQMMADPAMKDQLMAAAQAMMGNMQAPGGGLDFGAMAAQAQQLMQDDPDLVARIQEHLGDAGAVDAADDGDVSDDDA